MVGGLMQLVIYGAQDIYLTGNPLITYFKTVYRRHTNFAIESIMQTFNGRADFGKKVSSTITRNGDLMAGAYIYAVLPDLIEKSHSEAPQYRYTRWIENIGHYLIQEVSVEIGGKCIDTHYSDWLEIWSQLTVPASKMPGYLKMIGQDPLNVLGQPTGLQKDVFTSPNQGLTGSVHTAPYSHVTSVLKGREIYVPLQFWFCRNIGLSLPLIALQYHEVKINVTFRPIHELVMLNVGDSIEKGLPKISNWCSTSAEHISYVHNNDLQASLWIDYVLLDTDERRRFAQVSHEYLIEQVQTATDHTVQSSSQIVSTSIDLVFEHPVKELVWVAKSFDINKEYCNFTDTQMPVIPPFSCVGYDAATTSNVSGLSGLPLGYIDTGDLNITLTSIGGTASMQIEMADGTNGGVTLTVTGAADLLPGDIMLLSDGDNVIHITYNTDDLLVPAISLAGTYTLESIFRPVSALVLDNTNATSVSTTATGLTAVSTWDHLNRLTNYNMVRPVNQNGMARNPIHSAQLRLNGYERFETRSGEYFNWVQCRDHHTNIPRSPGINVYSFAINPEQHQPSGTCNFSRLQSSQLYLDIRPLYHGITGISGTDTGILNSRTVIVKVYAVNYNILRIFNGMGGVAYDS